MNVKKRLEKLENAMGTEVNVIVGHIQEEVDEQLAEYFKDNPHGKWPTVLIVCRINKPASAGTGR